MIQPGDLILYPVGPASRWTSRVVQWGEQILGQAPSQKAYSHVALAGADTRKMYEAYWPRVRYSDLLLSGIEIYRIRHVTPEQVRLMMAYAATQVGRWYDLLEIVTFGALRVGGMSVCSELVYNAALAAGVVLCPPEYLESPDDIAASLQVLFVESYP